MHPKNSPKKTVSTWNRAAAIFKVLYRASRQTLPEAVSTRNSLNLSIKDNSIVVDTVDTVFDIIRNLNEYY